MSFSDSDGESNWKNDLQANRLLITERVVYTKIHVQLLSKFIFDQDDDEEILNQFTNPTLKTQTNEMVNKLLKKGEENYKKFLKILGATYPDVYKSITGIEAPVPPQSSDLMPDVVPYYNQISSSSTHDVMNILIERLDLTKKECEDLARQNLMAKRDLDDRERDMSNLKEKIHELQRRSERYDSVERDMTALKDVLDQVKNDYYKVCMRLVDTNEENSRLREHNMAIRVETDKLKVEIRKMESTVNSERSVSVRLRKRIETGPTVQVIHSLQQEIDKLKLKLAQSSHRVSIIDEDVDTRIQILQHDKEEAIQMYVDATDQLNKLREEFHSAETLRDKYLEENERLQLNVSALKDDCEMYRNRRDAVWQQLQEVEKERDQLMKERNEAQMTAQNHMDEKTKYRAQIRKLEEKHDDLSHKLREKENELRRAQKVSSPVYPVIPYPIDRSSDSGSHNSTVTDNSSINNESPEQTKIPKWECRKFRCFETKYYNEFCGKSEFNPMLARNMLTVDGIFPEIPLVANYGKREPIDRNPRRGVIRKKVNRSDSKQVQVGSTCRTPHDNRSRASSTESAYQRKLDKENSNVVEIDAEFLKKHVKLIGGNESGIFVNQIMDSLTCTSGGKSLQTGMKLIEISPSHQQTIKLEKCTFEYISNVISDLNDVVTVVTDSKPQEYSSLKDKIKNSRMTGDSFYVRANFKWNAEDMLNFEKNEILHVMSTQQYAEMHWFACKIDPYNGNNASKCEIIPSFRYCIEHPLKQDGRLPKGRRLTESDLFTPSNKDLCGSTSLSVKNPSPKHVCCSHLVIGRYAELKYDTVANPYTLVKALSHAKDKPRSCLLLPQSLSKILSYKLTTIAEPLMFDFPFPESINCNENLVRVRLADDHTVVSFKSVSSDMQQIVTSGAVKKTTSMGKHCILSINENYIGIREYLRKLQSEDLFPIVIYLQTDKPRTVRMFVEEKSMTNTVFQDVILTGEQLKRFGCRFVTVNLDRCNRVEDAIQVIIEKIADESNRIVWQDTINEVVF